MKRVMIVGGPGSGKSTLARQLGEKTGLPVFHMDRIHWMSGWVERGAEEKTRLTREVHARESWVFEGGHSRTWDERVDRADTFIWLDVPVGRRIWRVLRRSATHYGRSRPDLPEGCPERFNAQTLEFLGFIWQSRHSARAKMEAIYRQPPAHLRVFRLASIAETSAFLAELPERS